MMLLHQAYINNLLLCKEHSQSFQNVNYYGSCMLIIGMTYSKAVSIHALMPFTTLMSIFTHFQLNVVDWISQWISASNYNSILKIEVGSDRDILANKESKPDFPIWKPDFLTYSCVWHNNYFNKRINAVKILASNFMIITINLLNCIKKELFVMTNTLWATLTPKCNNPLIKINHINQPHLKQDNILANTKYQTPNKQYKHTNAYTET